MVHIHMVPKGLVSRQYWYAIWYP